MIDFRFAIGNPWHKDNRDVGQKDYVDFEKQLSKNKSFELQISKWSGMSNFLVLRLDTHWFGGDHAGPEIWIEVFGYCLIAKVYDHRHWNYEEGRFQTYEEAVAEAEEWNARKTQLEN